MEDFIKSLFQEGVLKEGVEGFTYKSSVGIMATN
jgi:hypothetical protein